MLSKVWIACENLYLRVVKSSFGTAFSWDDWKGAGERAELRQGVKDG